MTELAINHPYWHTRDIINDEPSVDFVNLSFYIYRPHSTIDERSTYPIARTDFLEPSRVLEFIDSCPKDRDVAFQSNITCHDGSIRHIPMVDMATGARAHLEKLKLSLGEETYYEFVWFESGRSFHGYGSRLVNHDEWISHMGRLLLGNQKDLKPTVDPRWIGHRLIAGYSALRWSKNTHHYLKMPQKIFP
jgi:hypothetical protein